MLWFERELEPELDPELEPELEPELRFDALVPRLDFARLLAPDLRWALAAAGFDRDAAGFDREEAFVERLEPFLALALAPLEDPLLDRLRGLLGADLLLAILILFLVGNLPPKRGVPLIAGPNPLRPPECARRHSRRPRRG